MTCQLLIDCLYIILEYLKEDKTTLYSCLLVNRLLCGISVRILWKDISNVGKFSILYRHTRHSRVEISFFNTLIGCLPDESKEIFRNNEIFISTPILKPLFNYAKFCKVLSIPGINKLVDEVLRSILSRDQHSRLNDKISLIANEIIKMFMNQASLKTLICNYNRLDFYGFKPLFSFPCFPGSRNLSVLKCNSNHPSEFFHQLSQTCRNLQSILISFENDEVTNELKELISSQNNLKSLNLRVHSDTSLENIIPALTKHTNNLTKLHIYSIRNNNNLPLSFIRLFTNLQEILLLFVVSHIKFKDFEKLQYAKFPKLRTLKISYQCIKFEYLTKFLETNGKNLENIELCRELLDIDPTMKNVNNDLNLSIAKFCPNLKGINIGINDDEIDTLKMIFVNCQYLEFIKIFCVKKYLAEMMFEIVANYSPKNFSKLVFVNSSLTYINPENLESFLISWNNRKQKKLLKLNIIKSVFDDEYGTSVEYYYKDNYKLGTNYNQNLKIIEKYENLGVIGFRCGVL